MCISNCKILHICSSRDIDSLVEREFFSKVIHLVDEWFCVVSIGIICLVSEGKKLVST